MVSDDQTRPDTPAQERSDRAPERQRSAPDSSARPDPTTGEVRAGPGDAGLQARPEVNKGTPGTRQMSNRRLAIGLGVAALLGILLILALLLA